MLMNAEKRNSNSEFKAVAILYENAIALSKKNKYTLDEAMSYELAGRFYFEENFNNFRLL